MSGGHHHGAVGKDRLLVTIILNIVITVAEFIGGLISGYLALLADAVHNLSDVAALILAWLAEKGSRLPATKRSTYGLKRLEVMTALVSAVSLVVIAIFILVEAYERLVAPQALTHPILFLSIALIGLAGNGISVWMLVNEKDKSLNLKSAFLHLVFDTLSSVAVLIGGLIILFTGWVVVDALLSALIAVAIVWSAYQVIREAVLILLEAVPPGLDFDTVHTAITSVPRVQDVHDLHIWSLSSKEIALSCHVCVTEKDYQSGPDIMGEIDRMLHDRFHIGHSTIQLERADCTRNDLLCRYHSHI